MIVLPILLGSACLIASVFLWLERDNVGHAIAFGVVGELLLGIAAIWGSGA